VPKIVDRDARRSEIAHAVLRVVARDGVRGVTIRNVAREAGWSTGVIQHYFGDRQGLLMGALHEAGQGVSSLIERLAAIDDPMERLLSLLEAGLPLDHERQAMCRIFFYFWSEGIADPELGAALAAYYALWRGDVQSAIRDAQAVGQFTGHDPVRLAEWLVGLADGLGVQSMFDPITLRPSLLREHLADLVLRLALAPTTVLS